MKTAMAACLYIVLAAFAQWQPDFTTAMKIAREKQQPVLLNFSGSDWCIPCIRMHKDIFTDKEFLQMADTSLVMYNADFPRSKKNALAKSVKEQNELLADKYNPEGKFPFTLLLDKDGKVIKTWDGYPGLTPHQFTILLKQLSDANRK